MTTFSRASAGVMFQMYLTRMLSGATEQHTSLAGTLFPWIFKSNGYLFMFKGTYELSQSLFQSLCGDYRNSIIGIFFHSFCSYGSRHIICNDIWMVESHKPVRKDSSTTFKDLGYSGWISSIVTEELLNYLNDFILSDKWVQTLNL